MDALDLVEADLVDLVGAEVGGGRIAQLARIIFGAARQVPGTVIVGRLRLDRVQGREHGVEAALERAGQRRAGVGDQPFLYLRRGGEHAYLFLEVGEEGAVGAVGEDRKSVVWGKRVSVRVDLGGRRIIKKKKID